MLSRIRFLLLFAILVCPIEAHADDMALLLTGRRLPDGITVIPPTGHSGSTPTYYRPPGGRLVIPRYANGATHPAGQIIGWGPMSCLQGTQYGPDDGSDPWEIVVTEDHTRSPRQWINGTGSTPCVARPTLRDVTILGKDDVGNNYGSGGEVNGSWQWNPQGTAPYNDREMGAYLWGSGAVASNVTFYHIHGTCLITAKGGGVLRGPTTPFDSEKNYVGGISFNRVYSGIQLSAVDGVCGRVDGHVVRDWGIKVTAGAVQFEDAIHLWGVSSWPTQHIGVTPAPCIWLTAPNGGSNWSSGPWYVESSDIGIQAESSGNQLNTIYSKMCPYGSIVSTGSRNIFRDCHIDGYVYGTTTLEVGSTAAAIKFRSNLAEGDDCYNGQIVHTVGGPAADEEALIVDYTASSDTATISPAFSTAPSPDSNNLTTYQSYLTRIFLAGTAQSGSTSTTLKLAASTDLPDDAPDGLWLWLDGGAGSGQARKIIDYTGSTDTATVSPAWAVTPDATTTYKVLEEYPTIHIGGQYSRLESAFITVPNRPTGAPSAVGILCRSGNGIVLDNVRFLGGASGSNARGIVFNGSGSSATLNNCTIKCHFQWMQNGVGLDLYDGTTDRIASGNTIWVTYTDGTASSAIELAPTWKPETDGSLTATDKLEVNDVRINGVRYYRTGPH